MRRPPVLRFALVALAASAACTPTPTILPSNDLNRPTDINFMCLGAYGTFGADADGNPTETGPFNVTGRPMSVCHTPPDGNAKQPQPTVSIHNRTFAFVSNSASGDLSVIDADSWRLVDLDLSTGGYGRAPLGTLPEQISSTTDGCRLVSANRGSCDLSLVDPSTLLGPVLARQYNSSTVSVNVPSGNGIQRITPTRGDGTPLGAAPYEAVFLPIDTAGMDNTGAKSCGAATTSWRALVTFPTCDLVALVDLPSGNIVASAQAQATPNGDAVTFTDMGTSPSCPADCGTDNGAPIGTARPTSIAITPFGDHAYVSMAEVPAIFSLQLSPSSLAAAPIVSIPLHDGALGSNRVRLGVDPWAAASSSPAMPNSQFPGRFIGTERDPQHNIPNPNRNYLYVIARDGSLRIIDVFVPGAEQECETNFDPLNNPLQSADNRCIPYGSLNRRQSSAFATSGLRFPTIPIDVAAAYITRDTPDKDITNDEDTVNGGYAWVLTASGTIYLVNIDPQQRQIKAVVHNTQDVLFEPDPAVRASFADQPFVYRDGVGSDGLVSEPPPFPNQPRDRNFNSYQTALDPTLGLPRLDIPPVSLVTGPYLEPLYTQGTEDDSTALDSNARQTFVFYPDRGSVNAQGWDVTWEGTIVSPRYSGVLAPDSTTPSQLQLNDGGGQFCTAGVLAGDILTLNGCTADAQCPLGMVCLRDTTLDQVPGGFTVTGLCVSQNLKNTLAAQCSSLVSTVRHYEIDHATQSTLTLKPHLDEVVRSSLTPCRVTGAGGTPGTSGGGGATGTGGAAGMGGMGGAAGTGGAGTGGAAGAAGMSGTSGTGGSGGTGGTFGGPGCDVNTNDCFDPTDGTTCQFECVADLPMFNGSRCLNRCTKDQDCRHGRICLPVTTCTPGNTPADIATCPMGTTACKNKNVCFTDVDCSADPSVCRKKDQVCLHPDDPNVAADFKQCAFTTQSFCADGPPLTDSACFPQLVPYQVNANASFMVSGSVSGSLGSGTTDTNGECQPFPTTGQDSRDPRLVARIPLRPRPGQDVIKEPITCAPTNSTNPAKDVFPTYQTNDPAADGYFIDHFDPALPPTVADGQELPQGGGRSEASQLVDWMVSKKDLPNQPSTPNLPPKKEGWTNNVDAPNACLYLGGPIATETPHNADPTMRANRPQHVRARFRNTEIAFLLANIDRGPPAVSVLHFDVHGGFRQEAVLNLPTVQISAPARLVLGPVDSNPSTDVTTRAAPFFFVVDQRRQGNGQGGGPTRGQIVRVHPFGQPTTVGFLPAYEDYQRSGGLFPIQ